MAEDPKVGKACGKLKPVLAPELDEALELACQAEAFDGEKG